MEPGTAQDDLVRRVGVGYPIRRAGFATRQRAVWRTLGLGLSRYAFNASASSRPIATRRTSTAASAATVRRASAARRGLAHLAAAAVVLPIPLATVGPSRRSRDAAQRLATNASEAVLPPTVPRRTSGTSAARRWRLRGRSGSATVSPRCGRLHADGDGFAFRNDRLDEALDRPPGAGRGSRCA